MFHPDEQKDAEEPESEEGMEDEVPDDVGPGAGEGERGQEVEGQGEGGEGTDWAKINRQRKYKAGLFVCLADLQQRLVLTAVALEPGMAMLHEAFRLADSEFEIQQQRKVVAGEERTYRVLETARATLVNKCFQEVSLRIQTVEPALPKRCYTLSSRSFLFRMMSSFLCNVHATLRRFHLGFPYLLFRILDGKAGARAVYSAKQCSWDELAATFFTKYPTLESGTSEAALAFLQCLALMVETDSLPECIALNCFQKFGSHVPILVSIAVLSLQPLCH